MVSRFGLCINTGAVKDPYIYSLLMVIMKNNKFEDFIKTATYRKLYGDGTGYRQKIGYTANVRNEIIDLSQKFYLQKTSETK